MKFLHLLLGSTEYPVWALVVLHLAALVLLCIAMVLWYLEHETVDEREDRSESDRSLR